MSLTPSISRRRAVSTMAIVAMALVACNGPFCNDTGVSSNEPDFKSAQEAQGKTATPTPTASVPTVASPTATATSGAAATSATTVAGADRPQRVRLRGAFGVDHPPFAQNYGVGGNSVGLACIAGIPGGGTVTMQITGGTGAPPSILGGGGADGTVIIPFPIQQYGMVNGTISGLRVNGQPASFDADPFSYTVGAPELLCTPPR